MSETHLSDVFVCLFEAQKYIRYLRLLSRKTSERPTMLLEKQDNIRTTFISAYTPAVQ